MTLSDYLVSIIRTGVPVLVGLVLAKLAAKTGITADLGLASEVATGLAIGGYYAAVRALEARWPFFGVLLGWKAAPEYGWSQPAKPQLYLED